MNRLELSENLNPEIKSFTLRIEFLRIPPKNAAGLWSAVLVQAHCLHSTELLTRQETYRVNI